MVDEPVLTFLISTHGLYIGLGLKKELRPEENNSSKVLPATKAEMRKESSHGSVQ